jgi:hypothetical protein
MTTLRGTFEQDRIDRVPNSVDKLIKEALALSAPLVDSAPDKFKNRIWLYRTGQSVQISAARNTYLAACSSMIAKKHNLVDDAGKSMSIAPNRLRKTFAERIWQLTNGDVWKTARILGNTPAITNKHYLDVTPDMERNHRFVGQALELKARGTEVNADLIGRFSDATGLTTDIAEKVLSGSNNTGVSRCSNPVSGGFSPDSGDPCTKFLHCFRCPNQIVIQDDLYRLFSFYWLILSERAFVGRKRWKRLYGWVIREIDQGISPKFTAKVVETTKKLAREKPHPMWKHRRILGGEL